jgi:hypothetical protein
MISPLTREVYMPVVFAREIHGDSELIFATTLDLGKKNRMIFSI